MADSVAEHIAALKDEDWGVREDAATMLGQMKDPRGVRPLIDALRDSDHAVRTAATSSLTAIGEPAVEDLGSCLRDPDLTVQEAAASILSTIADDRVIEPLISALLSTDWVVRMNAARAVGRIGSAQAVDTLILLLQDKVPAVRDEATAALKSIGEVAVSPLVESLKDRDWRVRLRATEALGVLGSKSAVHALLDVMVHDPDTAVRQDATRALGNIGDPVAVDRLLVAMKDPRLQIRAIEALGKIGDHQAVPFLTQLIRQLDPRDYEGRTPACEDNRYEEDLAAVEEAIRALARIKDARAIPVLITALQSTLVRKEAAEALTVFGQPALVQLGSRFKVEQDENIRFHLQEAMSRLGWNPKRIRVERMNR